MATTLSTHPTTFPGLTLPETPTQFHDALLQLSHLHTQTSMQSAQIDLLTQQLNHATCVVAALRTAIAEANPQVLADLNAQADREGDDVHAFVAWLGRERERMRKEVAEVRKRERGEGCLKRRVVEVEALLEREREKGKELESEQEKRRREVERELRNERDKCREKGEELERVLGRLTVEKAKERKRKSAVVSVGVATDGDEEQQQQQETVKREMVAVEEKVAVDPTVPLPEVPFVLVLVDGDAYNNAKFVEDHARKADSDIHPAVRISRAIKSHLYRYISTHSLPAQTRLIVRVLSNTSSAQRQRWRKRRHQQPNLNLTEEETEDFVAKFTSTSPLFDCVNAGAGKERVDSKIHETYHTFLPDTNCRKIFLAAATDNGFARMLEGCIDHPVARAKTCLVSCGVVASEIEKLKLETIEWDDVFVRRFLSKTDVRAKEKKLARELVEAESLRKEREVLTRRLGQRGYGLYLRDRAIANVAWELNGAKNSVVLVEELLSLGRKLFGVRVGITVNQLRSPGFVKPKSDHGGLCIEEGVD